MCGTCGCGDENSITIRKPGEEILKSEHQCCGGGNHDEDQHECHCHGDENNDHSHENEHQCCQGDSDFDEEHNCCCGDDDHGHLHNHDHDHHHDHNHDHHHDDTRMLELQIERNILHKNDMLAERNRGYFDAKNITALNLVSSPGSGKTSLLERTIKELKLPFYVIEGDQQTMNDANRIAKAGAPVVQVNTGNGCHLDSDMINRAVKKLEIKDNSVLIIENVGNLVCPAMFDLGESKRVVVISTTEGEDKPIKYPAMFETSDICIINKIDLLPYLDFDVKKCKEYAMRVNHHLEFFEISVKTGEGMDKWYKWLQDTIK